MIYFLLADEISVVKIGSTIDLKKRMDDLTTSCPVDLQLFGILENYHYKDDALERAIHRYFEKRWKRGEWFTFDDEMLQDIGSWPYFVPAKEVTHLRKEYHCPSADEVLEIQELLKDPTTTLGSIYRKYGISRNTLLLIKNNTWTSDRSKDSRYVLPANVVREIFIATKNGMPPYVAAKKFSVSPTTAWNIARGKTYRKIISTVNLEEELLSDNTG